MTIRQQLLKMLYPLFNKVNIWIGKSNRILKSDIMATESFYSLSATLNNDDLLDFAALKGKKVMIVNTASDCGFTNQYEGLQALYEKFKKELFIIAFPSNDFGEQEKGDDQSIAAFCMLNYGVLFTLAKKTTVIKNSNQHEVYKWLTDDKKNGWNYVAPSWNFCKYLVDEKGNLTHFFEAAIDPMSAEIIEAVNA